jgi:hypothetical protein
VNPKKPRAILAHAILHLVEDCEQPGLLTEQDVIWYGDSMDRAMETLRDCLLELRDSKKASHRKRAVQCGPTVTAE